MKKYAIESDSVKEVEIVAEGKSLVIVKSIAGEFSVKSADLFDTELEAYKTLAASLKSRLEIERRKPAVTIPSTWIQPKVTY